MKYEDIIDLPHHVSGKHPRMTMYQRAAQFAPFAALKDNSNSPSPSPKSEEE